MKVKSMWRTIWLYIITSILLVSLSVAFSFSVYINSILHKNAESSFHDLSERLAQSASSLLRETELLALTMSRNTTLIDIMLRPDEYELDLQYDDYFTLRSILAHNNNYPQIKACRFAFRHNAFYTREGQQIFSVNSEIAESLALDSSLLQIDQPKWNVYNGTIRYIQPVHNYLYASRNIGLVILELSDEQMASLFSDIQSLENARFELAFNDQPIAVYGESAPARNTYLRRTVNLNSDFSLTFTASGLPHTLRLDQALMKVAPWILACCIVVYLLFTPIAKGFYRNISALSSSISTVELLSSQELQPTRYRELNIIVQNVNKMLAHIRQKFADELRERDKERILSLQMLESQINPHFLYNSLDVINWLAWQQGAEDVAELSRSLGMFYRDALSKTTNENSLAHELVHANTYLEIMKLRTEDELSIRMDIPDHLLDNVLPRLSLQPMLENAFQHGVLNRTDHQGEITICACPFDDTLEITVHDNGSGMSSEKLNEYISTLSVWPPLEMHGLINIHHRTRLLYGDRYGISLCSEEGQFFDVTLTVPLKAFASAKSIKDSMH